MNDGLKILFVLTMISIGIAGISSKIAKNNKLLKKAGEKEEVKVLLDRAGAKAGVIAGGRIFKCPFCAEWVKIEAKICKECGTNIEKEIAIFLTEEKRSNDLLELEMVKRREALQLEHEKNLAEKKAKKIKVISYLREYRKIIVVIIGVSMVISIIVSIFTVHKNRSEVEAYNKYKNFQIGVESIYMSYVVDKDGSHCFEGRSHQDFDMAIVFKLPYVKAKGFLSTNEIVNQIENFTLSLADNLHGSYDVDIARGTFFFDEREIPYAKTNRINWLQFSQREYLLFKFFNPGKECENSLNISGTNIRKSDRGVKFLDESIFKTQLFWKDLMLKRVRS